MPPALVLIRLGAHHRADKRHILLIIGMRILSHKLADAACGHLFDHRTVMVQGMPGQVQAAHFFLHLEQDVIRIFFPAVRQFIDVPSRLLFTVQSAEQIDLPVQIPPRFTLHTFEDALHAVHHGTPLGLQIVERPAFDHTFHRAAVDLGAMQTLAEIIQAAVRRAAALTHNGSDQVPPHIFQRQQAETDILSLHR